MWNLFKKKEEPQRCIALYNLQQIQAGERLCEGLSINKGIKFTVGQPPGIRLVNRECDFPLTPSGKNIKNGK